MEFSKIFDFKHARAIKLENESYLEELTGLLAKAASCIDDELNYFFGEEFYIDNHKGEPNSNFKHFIKDFENSFYNGSCEKINIIRGRAGIGKSLFFKKGIRQLIRSGKDIKDPYIYMGIDFRNIDNDEKIIFYEDWIKRKLYEKAIVCINALGQEIYDYFNSVYEASGLQKYETHLKYLFPLKFLCEKIYHNYTKPCMIIFDNIDLASVKTQRNVFDAIINVCEIFNDYMRESECKNCYRIYFAMRPETELRYREGRVGDVINFPLPNILNISLAVIKKVLSESANEFDNVRGLPCSGTCQDVTSDKGEEMTYETHKDVADYFYKILNYYLGDIWNNNTQIIERLGTSEEFHCNIVNYNVRTFLKFLSDTISNGGFKPLTREFNSRQTAKYYNTFDYIEMIIRGRWSVHPGNTHINGEGGNKAPIVFNVFDTSLYGTNQKERIKHFMLYIRILQYVCLYGDDFEVQYSNLEENLSPFFDKQHINKATRKLVYVRFLYSYEQGDNKIASIQNFQDVLIIDTTTLKLGPVGRFYLEKMICEFEYLYQMSPNALICNEYITKLTSCWTTEKELTVFCFLKSIFEIIKINISEYDPENLALFKKQFYDVDDPHCSRPFRRMIDRFISVMRNKVQRAEKWDTNSISKLTNILTQAQDLKKQVTDYFALTLGE